MPSNIQQRNLARHEKSMTLENLINHSAELLNEDGELWIIVPNERTEELIGIKEQLKLILTHRISIFGKPNRHVRDVLVFASKNKEKGGLTSLTIREEKQLFVKSTEGLIEMYLEV